MAYHDQVGLVGYSGERKLMEPLPTEKATRKIGIDLVVREGGTQREKIGPVVLGIGDSQSREFFVWLGSSGPAHLSMKVSLSRISEDERRKFITVKRRLPAVMSNAAD